MLRAIAVVLAFAVALAPVGRSQQGGDDPGKSVLENMQKNRGSEFQTIQELKTEILVVGGNFDKVQQVLDGLKIKYDLIRLADLPNKDLSPYVAVFINCYGEHPPAGAQFGPQGGGPQFGPQGGGPQFGPQQPGAQQPDPPGGGTGGLVPPQSVASDVREKVRSYVEGGGYLFTSDWAVVLAEKTFPEFLKQAAPTGQKNETISVQPKEAQHPFLKDVFTSAGGGKNTDVQKKVRKADWMIENRSLTFEILPAAKSRVKVLVVSDDLKKLHGSPLVAITFDVKAGKLATGKAKPSHAGVVFHVIGHFYQQGLGNQDNDEVAKMYQMIVNFIVEAKKVHKK